MNPRLLPIATFFAGVLLTVGVYETFRLVNNARNALSVASTQIAAEDGLSDEELQPRTRERRRRAVSARSEVRVQRNPQRLLPEGLRGPRTAPKPGASPSRPPPRSKAARRQRLEERMAEMTELERREFLEARRERRERRRAQQGRARPREVRPNAGELEPVEPEEEWVDTAEPPPE